MVKCSEYRAEAILKLKNNDVSVANMEVWIAGYIAGRIESEKELVKIDNKTEKVIGD